MQHKQQITSARGRSGAHHDGNTSSKAQHRTYTFLLSRIGLKVSAGHSNVYIFHGSRRSAPLRAALQGKPSALPRDKYRTAMLLRTTGRPGHFPSITIPRGGCCVHLMLYMAIPIQRARTQSWTQKSGIARITPGIAPDARTQHWTRFPLEI